MPKDSRRKLTAPERERSSACISKYAPHESDRRKLIAKCLSMAREGKLSKSGSYKKTKKS